VPADAFSRKRPDDRIVFTVGRDLALKPGQRNEQRSDFFYPSRT
jgi:hypothetical protein